MTHPLPLPDWLDELRLEPGPPFSTMGTRPLDLAGWLIADEHRDADLRRRASLITTERASVVALMEGSEHAGGEVLDLVREWLAGHGIDSGPGRSDDHPLVAAARIVQEDLVVLQRREGSWVVTAGVVCFPTHWSIGSKIGLPLAVVHARVAHYEAELRARMDRFHDRLTPLRPVWRRNWFVLPTSELHLPDAGHPGAATRVGEPSQPGSPIDPDGSPMWIRSERQTLRRLASTDAIVFTIRVQQAPLGVLARRLDLAERMLATVTSWDADKRAYTSTGSRFDELVLWLRGLVERSA